MTDAGTIPVGSSRRCSAQHAGADDEAARGFLAFLSVPVILTVAVLTSP